MDSPYHPLDSETEQIRVAVLIPGEYEHVINVRLRVESLPIRGAKKLQFEALICMGHEVSPHTIQVDGKSTPIGLNLDHALRRLRYRDKERILWVDALCINQANVSERNHQVHLMGRIYSSATIVVIWLGIGDEADVEAIQRITSPEHWNLQMFQTLTCIFERPWFRRVWVVQELVLARNDPMVYIGPASISYQTLWLQIYDIMRSPFFSAGLQSKEEPIVLTSRRFERALSPYLGLRNMRSMGTQHLPFVQNLLNTSFLKATDPRDKIFGILGLGYSSTDPIKVTPNYDKTICELLIDISMSIIKHNPLDLYYRFPLHPLRDEHMSELRSSPRLPTWAFDPGINTRYGNSGYEYNWPKHFKRQDYHLIHRFQSLTRFSADNVLHTVGELIGTIVDTSGDLLRSREAELVPRDYFLTVLPALEKIHNTLLEPKHVAKTQLWSIFEEISEDANTENKVQHPFPNHEHIFDNIAFITNKGRAGLAYHPDMLNGIRPGDVVVGLFGVNQPFVLRQVGQRNKYKMVNIAYIGKHTLYHSKLKAAAQGTTEDDIWRDLEHYNLQEYRII